MGVRGTVFFVKAEPGKDVLLCTCSGIVAVDEKAIIIGKHHDSPRWIQAGTTPIGKRLKPAEKGEEHSDVEAGHLAKLLGM